MTRPLVALILIAACSHNSPAESNPPQPPPEQPAPVHVADAGTPAAAAPVEPVDAGPAPASLEGVTLPAAPALPATPAFLGDIQPSNENPLTPEKAALGHQLFFDKRMSKTGMTSCESCHHPAQGWTSGEATDKKDDGKQNKRNAPTMVNLGYHQNGYYWDGRMPTLEAVTNAAWKGQLGADPKVIAQNLNAIATYRAAFQRAFKEDATAENVPKALASFLRALKTGNAPWDKYEGGDKKAVSKEAIEGQKAFEKANCALCHAPPLYTDTQFHATGAGLSEDHGRMDASKDPKDDGKFKTPTLRDVVKTGPYFHDGSTKTLDEAIDFMLAGGKPGAPNLDEKLKPHKLSDKERKALKAFIESLSGTATYTEAPQLP
jgi:cytochrome c peroxidase